MSEKIIAFLKGVMQPMLTIAMVIVFVGFAMAGKFTSDQVWQVCVGIIVFWFGYTAFKFGTGNSGTGDGTSPKANSPVTGDPTGNASAVQGWGEPCTTCGTSSSDKSDFTMGEEQPPEPIDKVNDIIQGLFYDLEADGVKSTPAAIASRVVSWLGVHQGELRKVEQDDLINFGLDLAKKAYTKTTGLDKVPAKYSEVSNYNKWWRENQKACKAPKGEARAVLMTLRDLLKRNEAL